MLGAMLELLAESVTKSKKTLEGQGEPPQESPREQGALSVTQARKRGRGRERESE